jgi:hypothetical protein
VVCCQVHIKKKGGLLIEDRLIQSSQLSGWFPHCAAKYANELILPLVVEAFNHPKRTTDQRKPAM